MTIAACEICGDPLTAWEGQRLAKDVGEARCTPCVRSAERRRRESARRRREQDIRQPSENAVAATDPPVRRTSWTAAELLAAELPEPRWAVDGLFPEGLSFMAGAPKLGKSWMGLGIGIAIASGGSVFGQISVEQGDVLYLALEDNARRLQGRLRLLLNGDRAPDGLYLETEWPRLDDGGAQKLVTWLNEHPAARLVVVDVYPRVRPYSRDRSNPFQADYEAAMTLQTIAVTHGVAIVVLYHTRKAEASDFVEEVQGTLGTAAAADTILVVKRARGEPDATLHVTGRDVHEQELALRFAPEAGTWALLGDAGEYALGKTRKKIVDAIRNHGPLTPKELSEVADISHDLAKKTMQRMFTDGQLVADSEGRYALAPPVPAVPASPEGSTETGGHGGHRASEGTLIPDDEGVESALPADIEDDDWLEDLGRTQEALELESSSSSRPVLNEGFESTLSPGFDPIKAARRFDAMYPPKGAPDDQAEVDRLAERYHEFRIGESLDG